MDYDTRPHDIVECEPATPARHTVIWLHGLGADGYDFVPMVEQIAMPADLGVRFIFPHAPVRPVTLNGGAPARAWFDLSSLDYNTIVDTDAIRSCEQRIQALVAREGERGITPERIVLAGFSQGGAVALHTAPRFPQRLAGLIALSTFCLTNNELANQLAPSQRGLPVFMAHGTQDPVVLSQFGADSRDQLTAAGLDVSWHEYAMPHAVCPQEINDIRAWLITIFAASDGSA